ncbi:MAG: GNVR domain-containing protein [Armatimonadota bacterium]|nr:GNVR domain-containing protein [Armatimonadota bacterium]
MTGGSYEPMTARDHLRLLGRRRWVLLGVLGACVAAAGAYVLVATPVYEARAELVVVSEEPPRAAVLSAAPVLSMLGEPVSALGGADLATQVQLVCSRPALQGAWGILHERPDLLERLRREGLSEELFESLPQVLASLPPQPPPTRWPEHQQALFDTLLVAAVEDSQLIEVRCEYTDPEMARDFINALVLSYLGRSLADARAATRRTRSYIEEQIADVERRLAEAEESLRSFGERVGTVELQEAARQQIGLVVRLSEQAAMARSTANAQAALQEELMGELGEVDERIVRAIIRTRNPQIAELQKALAHAEAERVGLLEEYAPESMPLRSATATVEELRGQLRAASAEVVGSREEAVNPVAQQLMERMLVAQGDEMAARKSLEVLREAVARAEDKLEGLPDDQVGLLRLQREVELLERIYMALKEREQDLAISERAKTPASRLVEHAILPDEPARPRPLLSIAAGVGAGLLLGLLAVGLAEHLDLRPRDPQRAARMLGLPVLAVLGGRWCSAEHRSEADAEALSALLRQVGARAGERSVAVLSAGAGDAARALAGALAEVAGEEGRSVRVREGEPSSPDASHEMTLVVPQPGAAGLLEALPGLGEGWPAVVIVDLARTNVDAAGRLTTLAEESGGRLIGTVAVGARRSRAEYFPAETERRV